jgi:predicted Zn-dependent peptidase
MKTKIFKLNNGVTGVIVPIPGLKSVTVEAFLKIGSKYELKNEFGMSHFLEHMAFKGTIKRPTASIINKEIDSRGANYNAGTGHEMTSYFITTIKENIPWAIEMVADILTNSIYDETEVLKERGVIMEEIKMYQDNPMMGLSGEMTKFLYGKSKIGCWNIAGEVSDIEDVNREKVVNFRNKFINPKEMVVVVAGNVDLEASNEVEKYFSSLTNKLNLDLPEVKVVLGKQKEKNIRRKMEQGHFAMAVPGITWKDKRKYAFKLLDIVLNGSSSSRLYQKIREDNALAYYVFSISESFAETGFWGVQSGVKLEKMDEAMEMVREELKMVTDNLKEEELKRAKDYLIGKTELVMDRTDYWSNFVGERLLLEKKMETIEDELNRYRKVELKELKSLAGELFKEQEIRQVCIRK